jgi:hypothetical protein
MRRRIWPHTRDEDLDRGVDIAEHCRGASNGRVLRFPADVGIVEIVEVVIEDSGRRVAVREDVPHRLKQRAGREPAIREPHQPHATEDRDHNRVSSDQLLERVELVGHGRVFEIHVRIVTAAARSEAFAHNRRSREPHLPPFHALMRVR